MLQVLNYHSTIMLDRGARVDSQSIKRFIWGLLRGLSPNDERHLLFDIKQLSNLLLFNNKCFYSIDVVAKEENGKGKTFFSIFGLDFQHLHIRLMEGAR